MYIQEIWAKLLKKNKQNDQEQVRKKGKENVEKVLVKENVQIVRKGSKTCKTPRRNSYQMSPRSKKVVNPDKVTKKIEHLNGNKKKLIEFWGKWEKSGVAPAPIEDSSTCFQNSPLLCSNQEANQSEPTIQKTLGPSSNRPSDWLSLEQPSQN